jgi:hypothetical protein
MPAYHQMGHHSSNLIDIPELSKFSGAIFSPINRAEDEIANEISVLHHERPGFECILDPQLYVPKTQRGKLKDWKYYPKDVDTADLSSRAWWASVARKLSKACSAVSADAICSPAILPKVFDDKYYKTLVGTASDLAGALQSCNLIQTAVVSLSDLTGDQRPLQIASIISQTPAKRVYVVLVGNIEPRRELKAVDELVAAMQFISALEGSELRTIVGFCSSELLLWKAAGATDCASGKFFNLRRFTRTRFEEPSAAGGGQLPYWFEEALLAFLRQGDLLRLRKARMLSSASNNNPFALEILTQFDNAKTDPTKKPKWLALSWRQFLYWFADIESRLARGEETTRALLTTADRNWTRLDESRTLLEERVNDGAWIRAWLNALTDFGG